MANVYFFGASGHGNVIKEIIEPKGVRSKSTK